jgi:hypothetical protein
VSAAAGGASAAKAGRSVIVGAAPTDNAAKILKRNLSLFVVFMHIPGSLVAIIETMQIPRRRYQIDQCVA